MSSPTGIVVTGTASGCATGLVKVTVSCGTPVSLLVPVDAAGAWTATFATGGGCQCTKPISVKASCSDGLCEASFDGPLQCKVVEDACPEIETLTVTVDGCADPATGATAA